MVALEVIQIQPVPDSLSFVPSGMSEIVSDEPANSRDRFQAASLPLHGIDICGTDLSSKRYASRDRTSSREFYTKLPRWKACYVSLCAQERTS